jgi:hypothetical protein
MIVTNRNDLQWIGKNIYTDGFAWCVWFMFANTIPVIDFQCIGEMHFIPSTADAWFNLPRKGGVAYAAQESWVQNETIRDNILFGSAYDEVRYQKGKKYVCSHLLFFRLTHNFQVIHQCALERDLELFDAGDETEVGERGLTLR